MYQYSLFLGILSCTVVHIYILVIQLGSRQNILFSNCKNHMIYKFFPQSDYEQPLQHIITLSTYVAKLSPHPLL